MVTRVKASSKFAAKSTVQQAEHIEAQATKPQTAWQAMQADLEALGIKVPTPRRWLVACIASFFTSFSATYFGCFVAEWLALGAAVYTGSAFLAFLVLVLGYFMAIYVAYKAGMAVSRFVLDYSNEAVRNTAASVQAAAKSKVSLVRGWFTRDSSPVAA